MTAVIRLGVLDARITVLGLQALMAEVDAESCEGRTVAKIDRLTSHARRFMDGKGGLVRVDPVDILILQRAARRGMKLLNREAWQQCRTVPGVRARTAQLRRRKLRLLGKLEMNRKRLHRRLARKGAGWRQDAYEGLERSTVPVGTLGVKSDRITRVGETADPRPSAKPRWAYLFPPVGSGRLVHAPIMTSHDVTEIVTG